MTSILITRAGPLASIQDGGRRDMRRHGISASGPMDRGGFASIGGGSSGIEFTTGGIEFTVEDGGCRAGLAGGVFTLTVNGEPEDWPSALDLAAGDEVSISAGLAGNYGYVRFDRDLDVPPVLGSRSTNLTVRLGGFGGRLLVAGDRIALTGEEQLLAAVFPVREEAGPMRVVWGLHADLFAPAVRERFLSEPFRITSRMDRMGVRLADPAGVFRDVRSLSLVSDAIVPGDIQILGDGTPIVLMRDHQPTGGYPRIATVISADLDRFAQLRPGAEVRFAAVGLDKARAALLSSRS